MNKLEAIQHINKDIVKLGCFDKSQILPNDRISFTILDSKFHYSFYANEPLQELQLTVSLFNNFCDILLFPHPIILDKENTLEAIRFINIVNSHCKPHNSNGRFYVDEEYLDIVFSSRISYDYIEAFPKKYIEDSVVSPMNYFFNISTLILMFVTVQ